MVLREIFAFSTISHFSHQEALHIKTSNTVEETYLLDSLSWLVVSGELHECDNKEIYLSGAILLFLSLDAEVAVLDLTVGAGSLLSLYSLPFKSLCYSVEFSFLTRVFVKMSQFLLRHNPDHLFSQVTYLVKEWQFIFQ